MTDRQKDDSLKPIFNFRRLSDRVITSGLPTAEQLRAVADAGFHIDISLLPDDDEETLPHERAIAEALGMTYVQIPVIWTRPTHEDLIAFFEVMARYHDRELYVHCAANFRVSAFMALYRVLRLGWTVEAAMADLHAIWEPYDWWQTFIKQELESEDWVGQMDVVAYNRDAWDRQVRDGNEWTVPVSAEVIAAARRGEWSIVLTACKPVPREWFPALTGADVLCLASGGGQQGPVLAAAGANVTVFDNSPAQLSRDRLVADRDGLDIRTVQGDMRDLSAFADDSFDLVFHPVSNLFCPEVRPVWREAHRVLRHGGVLLAGFMNPANYIFDYDLADATGELQVRYTLPYADATSKPEAALAAQMANGAPLEYSHSLTDQIGGQLDAGFVLTALYEDHHPPEWNDPVSQHMPVYIATRAVKAPGRGVSAN